MANKIIERMVFDSQMELTDTWIDFHVGKEVMDEIGIIRRDIFLGKTSHLSTLKIDDIATFRDILHKQLDKIIDECAVEIPKLRRNGVSKVTISNNE